MSTEDQQKKDAHLREVMLAPLRKCLAYKPAFGSAKGETFELVDFKRAYDADPFYHWMGLSDDAVYAAHKAAGGLTSVYRQLGIGSERLLRAIFANTLGLNPTQLAWEYSYQKSKTKSANHKLDAKLEVGQITDGSRSSALSDWLSAACKTAHTDPDFQPRGVVFEIRQGYKSADSKRQNADLRFGIRASQASLLPAFAVMSTQVTEPVIARYLNEGMLVLRGTLGDDPTVSTFAFMKQVVGYDLASFFERNSGQFQTEIKKLIEGLLSP